MKRVFWSVRPDKSVKLWRREDDDGIFMNQDRHFYRWTIDDLFWQFVSIRECMNDEFDLTTVGFVDVFWNNVKVWSWKPRLVHKPNVASWGSSRKPLVIYNAESDSIGSIKTKENKKYLTWNLQSHLLYLLDRTCSFLSFDALRDKMSVLEHVCLLFSLNIFSWGWILFEL